MPALNFPNTCLSAIYSIWHTHHYSSTDQ